MKLVIGIVRPEMANDVLEALFRAKIRGVSMSKVQGHGGELQRVETYRGTTVQMGLSEKIRFEIAVSEEYVETTVQALSEGGRTGEVGDGKIFVLSLDSVVRVRTGETDDDAVTPVGNCGGTRDRHRRYSLDDDVYRPGAHDDTGAGPLLRGTGPLEEHTQHVHDEHGGAGRGHHLLGSGRLLARLQRR